jgi:hypothetical protein
LSEQWVEPEKTVYPLPKVKSLRAWRERLKAAGQEVYNLLQEGIREGYI